MRPLAMAIIVATELIAHGSTERSCLAFQAPLCGLVGSCRGSSLVEGRSRSSASCRAYAGLSRLDSRCRDGMVKEHSESLPHAACFLNLLPMPHICSPQDPKIIPPDIACSLHQRSRLMLRGSDCSQVAFRCWRSRSTVGVGGAPRTSRRCVRVVE